MKGARINARANSLGSENIEKDKTRGQGFPRAAGGRDLRKNVIIEITKT